MWNGKLKIIRPVRKGFTLIELLVVMAIIALLLSIAVPKYFGSVDRSRETILRQDLSVMREAIDKFYSDKNRYPDNLEDLVTAKYIRSIPKDPITNSETTWIVVAPKSGLTGSIYDIKSGAPGLGADGTAYESW
jgi:general secretion pathway protein G